MRLYKVKRIIIEEAYVSAKSKADAANKFEVNGPTSRRKLPLKISRRTNNKGPQ